MDCRVGGRCVDKQFGGLGHRCGAGRGRQQGHTVEVDGQEQGRPSVLQASAEAPPQAFGRQGQGEGRLGSQGQRVILERHTDFPSGSFADEPARPLRPARGAPAGSACQERQRGAGHLQRCPAYSGAFRFPGTWWHSFSSCAGRAYTGWKPVPRRRQILPGLSRKPKCTPLIQQA